MVLQFMKEEVSFSILMAVYSGDDSLLFERALRSVFDNSLKPHRVVLIVDGPIGDRLEFVISKFNNQSNFLCVRLEKNGGLSKALNIGLRHIETEWVIRADSDDYNKPDRFAKLFVEMKEDCDLIGSWIVEVDREGVFLAQRKTPLSHEDISDFMRWRNPFNHMSVAYRVSEVLKCGGYPNIYLREDYGLWINMLACGSKMKNIPEILVYATTGRDMYLRRGGLKYARGETQLQKLLVDTGLKTNFSAVIDGLMRSCIFLAPVCIRKFFYEKFLRN